MEDALEALFGSYQDPTNAQLAKISTQIQTLTSIVSNLSAQSKYQSTFMDVTVQIQSVVNMIAKIRMLFSLHNGVISLSPVTTSVQKYLL